MKKILLWAGMTMFICQAQAQSLNVSNGLVTYQFPISSTGEMLFENESVNILDRRFELTAWPHMSVVDEEPNANTVVVNYSAMGATVTIAGNIAGYVDASVNGCHVSIAQSSLVSDTTCGEITYILQGESSYGSLTLSGSYKSTVELCGLTLTNPSGCVLNIDNGKRIALSAKNGTINTIIDGAGSQKGAIVCKGHLELKGKGTLNVTGIAAHAIYSKEYVEIKNLTLNVTGAAKDGINCGQYFSMESGMVNISNTGDDGIQASFKDDTDREIEDTGSLSVKGGSLTVSISADGAKCLKADGDVTISGGTLSLTTSSNGLWDSSKNKTKASACIGADGNITVTGGEIGLGATGSGGKGISCDGTFTMNEGDLKIATSGGLLVYSNGSLNHNYTGTADRINADYKSSSKGIKADEGVTINGGNIHITTSTNNAEGIESKKNLQINGGTIFVKAYDDGINSTNNLTISGGDVTVISIVGDGLDSNGNLNISGGFIRTMGSGGMEMGLDAATESGYAVYFTGGTLLAFGGSNTYPTKTGSTQAFVNTTGAITAGSEISIRSGENQLATFTIPDEYNSSTAKTAVMFGPGNGPGGGGWNPGGGSGSGSLIISCPELVSGSSYTVVNNGVSISVTAKLTGNGR